VVPDGVAGGITKLPGGVKCADLFNNDQPVCVFEIQVGTITPGTPADVRYLIDHRDSYPRKIWGSAVYLDSLGGDVAAAIEIGRLIRDQKMPAVIDSSAKCVSACVLVLAGATQRKIRGAVGIHRPYFAKIGNANSPDVVVQSYRELLKQAREAFGLGEGPPEDDIETVASLKEAAIIKIAAAYGLSRLEYDRRSAFYDEYGFQPIVVVDGEGRFITAVLRPAKRPGGKEIRAILRRLLRAIRTNWPNPQILLRADSHYCCPEVLDWCRANANGLDYILGVAPTTTLRRHIEGRDGRPRVFRCSPYCQRFDRSRSRTGCP
jgi:hypothetical protein